MADKNPFWLEDLHSHTPLWVNLINNILFFNSKAYEVVKLLHKKENLLASLKVLLNVLFPKHAVRLKLCYHALEKTFLLPTFKMATPSESLASLSFIFSFSYSDVVISKSSLS